MCQDGSAEFISASLCSLAAESEQAAQSLSERFLQCRIERDGAVQERRADAFDRDGRRAYRVLRRHRPRMGRRTRGVALLLAIAVEECGGLTRLSVHRDAHLARRLAILRAPIQIVDGQEEGRTLVPPEIPAPEYDFRLCQREAVLQIGDEPLCEDVVDHLCTRDVVCHRCDAEESLGKRGIERNHRAEIPRVEPVEQMDVVECRVGTRPVDNLLIRLEIAAIAVDGHLDAEIGERERDVDRRHLGADAPLDVLICKLLRELLCEHARRVLRLRHRDDERNRLLRHILRADAHDELTPICAGAYELLVLERIVAVVARKEMLRRIPRELAATEGADEREPADTRKRIRRCIVPESQLICNAVLAVSLTQHTRVVRINPRHYLDVTELHRAIYDLYRLVTERDRRRPKLRRLPPRSRRAAECTDIRRCLLVGVHRSAAAAALDRANLLGHETHLPFDG